MSHALVILSGGQDSTTCLGMALTQYDKVSCVTFDYGQSHFIELEAARRVVKFFRLCYNNLKIQHETIQVPRVLKSSSPLTNDGQGLETYESNEQMEREVGNRVEKTFVPLRNLFFLVLAANHAHAIGADTLITGVCESDNANYPDCRKVFIDAAQQAINTALGDGISIRVEAPLIDLDKSNAIRQALATPYTYRALAYSHTAYDGKYPPTGKDHASVLRAHGFEQAGVPDPLVLRAWSEGLMPLPDTANYNADKLEWAAMYFDYMADRRTMAERERV